MAPGGRRAVSRRADSPPHGVDSLGQGAPLRVAELAGAVGRELAGHGPAPHRGEAERVGLLVGEGDDFQGMAHAPAGLLQDAGHLQPSHHPGRPVEAAALRHRIDVGTDDQGPRGYPFGGSPRAAACRLAVSPADEVGRRVHAYREAGLRHALAEPGPGPPILVREGQARVARPVPAGDGRQGPQVGRHAILPHAIREPHDDPARRSARPD